MSSSLQYAQAFKADFKYLIGTFQPINDKSTTSLVKES
jgi:hypothetical protein